VAPHREIHSVKVRYEPDEGPGRYRIGLIVPAEDAVSERDFRLMLPDDSVAIFTNRIETTQIGTVEELKKMAPLLQKVATLVLTDDRLDVLVYSCTSATVAIGYENVASSLVSARAETPVVTPITAALAAFRALPYPDDVNVAMYDYLEEQGAVIRGFYAFKGLLTDYEVSRLPPRAIYEAGLEADNPDVEAVWKSRTSSNDHCANLWSPVIKLRSGNALGTPVARRRFRDLGDFS
jgi:maleate isomerase